MKKFNKKEYMKEYHLKNKEKKKEYDRKRYYTILKDQYKKDYLENREQRLKCQREYRLKNKERIKEYQKKYRLKNKKYLKKWRIKNIERIRNWENNKYKTDINFKLRKNCRNRIRKVLKGINKSASTMELIGCTIEELRKHIESKFEPWMTWENHGLWDVDHIEACANFDLTDPVQQRICFHWSNLQPLEHIANIQKGAQ
jgi:hypothetical protein